MTPPRGCRCCCRCPLTTSAGIARLSPAIRTFGARKKGKISRQEKCQNNGRRTANGWREIYVRLLIAKREKYGKGWKLVQKPRRQFYVNFTFVLKKRLLWRQSAAGSGLKGFDFGLVFVLQSMGPKKKRGTLKVTRNVNEILSSWWRTGLGSNFNATCGPTSCPSIYVRMWVIYMQSITTAPQYGESNKPEESWLLEAGDPDPDLEPGTPSQARIPSPFRMHNSGS